MGIHYTCCQGHSRTYRGYGDIFIVYFLCLQSVYGQSLKALVEKNGTTMSFLVQFMNWEGGGKSKERKRHKWARRYFLALPRS